ncbi:retrotransposon-derived protein PEG10 [Crotalus adamanteus]|uniref:Gypsy retrotransposon integrase-like protein 1 n=1 Tax=Crotalus adamanteus TaxID=8729 RepID=A0AAW1B106_CROAD
MNDQQQQRAPPPPAVQQQRRPLQPPLAQPPLGGLQQQGVPSNPAGQRPWNQPQWGPQQPVFAPPFNATFDGDPEKLIFFLNQVRSHLNRWAYLYPEPGAMVDVIGANLEGEASEWLNNLYSEQALELEDPHLFLLGLRERFEDPSIGLKAAGQIHKIKQAGRPALEYVREFRKMAGRIEGWPEQSLIHHFIEGLDDHLSQACIYREVPDRLQEWYQTAVKLDVKLSRYKKPPPQEPEQQLELPEQQSPPRKPSTTARAERPRPPARLSFECFRCGQGGHRAATCPVPYPRLQSKPGPAMQKKPAQRLPREKSNRLTQEPVAQVTPHTQENAKTPGGPAPALPFFDSNDEGENDPMVSQQILPFSLPAKLVIPTSGAQIDLNVLIDSGCTRCIISLAFAMKMGIRAKQLSKPMRFEQADGSLMGGTLITQLTEPLRLEIGAHWEFIRFLVAPKMTEAVILGLAWLDKWKPFIWWEKGMRIVRLPIGPDPPIDSTDVTGHLRPPNEQAHMAVSLTPGEPVIPKEYLDLAEVFSEKECDALPPHRPNDCSIELVPGAKLPRPRMYAMSPLEMEEMQRYVNKNLARGFIERAKSSVGAPVLFKEKKDGSLRLCVDYKGLNAVSVENKYPLPLLKDLLTHLAKGSVFTKLDLREAYYRVRIKEGDEWKTAFNCPMGSYQFKVMPFGLQGAPAVFMQLINEVLHDHLYKGVLVYLDDILIYSTNMNDHIKLVREVLKKLLNAKLYVKLSKCEFHRTQLDYLGYRISNEGIEMDPAKVKTIIEWQPPRTRKQLQSFLGFANFYRQFIPSFAEIALPLTELLKTGKGGGKPRPGQPLAWTMSCQTAFENLKRLFAAEPVLKHPCPGEPFVIQADASDVAVGAVLLQKNKNGILQPCAYTSKKFTESERRWAIWEKEAFAIRWALLNWRHYLEGSKVPFEVWTDHKNLEALKTPRKLSPKQVRWAQYFNRFNFTLKYIPGGKNFLADALSRLPQYKSEREQVNEAIIPNPQTVTQLTPRRVPNPDDPGVKKIKRELLTDQWFKDNQASLTCRDGLAYKGGKLYLPEALRLNALNHSHDVKQAGHFGYLKTLHLTRRQFWWPGLKKDVENYVKSCTVCATMKRIPGKTPGLLQPVADPSQPWEEVAMDFIVDLPESKGNTVIWTVIDLFSKQAHFIACKGLPSAQRLAKLFLKHIYRLHGAPKRIISDRGVQFTAKFWRNFLTLIGSSQGLSSAFHPATNGAAEAANKMVEQYLRCYVSYQQTNWTDLLPFAEVAYNNSVHSSTGYTPFKVATGKEFNPIPEYPQLPSASQTLDQWDLSFL